MFVTRISHLLLSFILLSTSNLVLARPSPVIIVTEESTNTPPDIDLTLPHLRILPLGDSITWGYQSTSGNGYRLPLLNLLNSHSWPTTFVGTQYSGNMSDNANEGHPGAYISQIANYSLAALPLRPNVILVMAGTNDMATALEVDTAPDRLSSLIDTCIKSCPDAAIVIAQLTPAANTTTEARIQAFNAKLPALVSQKQQEGKKVGLVDMSAVVSAQNLTDGLHPNDYGYEQMGREWFTGIDVAFARKFIGEPVVVNGTLARL